MAFYKESCCCNHSFSIPVTLCPDALFSQILQIILLLILKYFVRDLPLFSLLSYVDRENIVIFNDPVEGLNRFNPHKYIDIQCLQQYSCLYLIIWLLFGMIFPFPRSAGSCSPVLFIKEGFSFMMNNGNLFLNICDATFTNNMY